MTYLSQKYRESVLENLRRAPDINPQELADLLEFILEQLEEKEDKKAEGGAENPHPHP